MSHFSVLVSFDGDDPEGLAKALQPFHEYECTGIRDEYVQFIDLTAELEEGYATDESTFVVDETGRMFWPWDNDRLQRRAATASEVKAIQEHRFDGHFFRDWSAGSDKFEVLVLQPGQTIETRKLREFYPTMGEYAADYHSYEFHDGLWGRWTNPNAKWDWWQVGGRRYSGKLKLKDGEWVNAATAGDVDWEGMAANAERERAAYYDGFQRLWAEVANTVPPRLPRRRVDRPKWWQDWNAGDRRAEYLRETFSSIDDYYRSTLLHRQGEQFHPYIMLTKDDWRGLLGPRDEYLAAGRGKAATYALLHDGKWLQSGEMGWWGMDTPTTEYDYDRLYWEAVAGFDPALALAVVDCHI